MKVTLPTGFDEQDEKQDEEKADDDDGKRHVAIENSSTMRICQYTNGADVWYML